MKYYKILVDNIVVGIGTSESFKRYLSKNCILIKAIEANGEYIQYNSMLYHAEWMAEIITDNFQYTFSKVILIDEHEYTILKQQLESNIEIQEVENIPVPQIQQFYFNDPINYSTLDTMRKLKLQEMSRACNQIIEAGFDLELNGKTEHFSLTTQDQLNLISLSSMAANGMEAIPYHADGEICRFYSNEEMQMIVARATAYKIYHTTYYNALKNYINSLDSIDEIAAITYGVELPEEYQSDVLKSLQ